MNKKLIAIAALLPCLALVGCAATAPVNNPSFTTVAPAKPSPTSTNVVPAADGIVDSVYVQVFPRRTFKSAHGCRCTLPHSAQELFPVGTPVVLMKVTMIGEWKPSQGAQTYQDVTGTTLKGTQFDGRPEPAVLDTADGPAAAKSSRAALASDRVVR